MGKDHSDTVSHIFLRMGHMTKQNFNEILMLFLSQYIHSTSEQMLLKYFISESATSNCDEHATKDCIL